jgi:hypothetical protein
MRLDAKQAFDDVFACFAILGVFARTRGPQSTQKALLPHFAKALMLNVRENQIHSRLSG